MGSKGSTTQQTSQSSQYRPSPQIQAAGTQALQGGQAAAQQPFWLPQQPVAGFTPDQLAAFQNVRNIQGMTAPWFGQAGNLAQMSATPLTADQIANFYNPMAQNVTNQLNNIYGQQMRETTGQLTQAAGGVGADRIAVGQSQLANQQGLASGQIYAQLYQQALNAAMQNQQMQANAAYAMGNLGQGAQGAALQGTQALLGTGGLQQQLAQAQLMSPYAWLGQQFAYPYQANQYLAGITGSLVPAFPSQTTGQGTSVTTPAQPSALSQGLGLGMAGLGALQNFGYNPLALNAGNLGGTGGGLGGIYAHGGRVHRQMGGQTPFLPQQASQIAGQSQTPLPGNTGPRFGMADNDADDRMRTQFAGANPQVAIQQAMQSPQFQQLMQQYPWLQQAMQNPQQAMGRMQNPTFGTGSKGSFSWPNRGFADGGPVKAPAIPQMTAGTASDMDAYFSKINDQAQNLAAMSRNAMQPTGTGGWQSPFFGTETPTISNANKAQAGQIPAIFSGQQAMKPPFGGGQRIIQSPFHPSALNPQETVQPVSLAGGQLPDIGQLQAQPNFQQGGGVGTDPFGQTDDFVPDIHLNMSNFQPPKLPQTSGGQQASSSGKGSGIGQAIGIAAQVLPFMLAARGGGVGPFAHYQHFQDGGGDDMTDINAFPFTPPDASPIPPSPEDLRPPVPTPFAGWGDAAARAAKSGFDWLRPTRGEYATPQEADQARASKELFAKQVAATPVGTTSAQGPTPEVPVAQSPFVPPAQPTGQGPLATDEAQRQAMSAGMPQTGVPMPQPRPDITQAPMPQPRPDIAGMPGQGVASPFRPPAPSPAGTKQDLMWKAVQSANRYGIPPNIFLALLQHENGFTMRRGAAGEIGPGQIMPETGRSLKGNINDPFDNIDMAAQYLRRNYDATGSWQGAIMGYNAGTGAVTSGRIPASTRNSYLPAVTALSQSPAFQAMAKAMGEGDTTELSANGVRPGPAAGPTGGITGQPLTTGAGQYQLPPSQAPFPQAGMNYPGMSLAQNPLFRMGASIAASRSPWPAVAIGEGMSAWAKGAQEEAGKQVTANQAAQKLWLQMQEHKDAMTKLTAGQQLEAMKPFRIGVDPETGLDVFGIRDPSSGAIRKIDLTSGQMIGPPIGGTGTTGTQATGELQPRDAAVERFKAQDEETQKQYAAPELAPNLIPDKQPGTPIMKGPFATGEAATIRAYNDNNNKKVRPALDFQREQITRLKLDYATIMRDEGEGFFTRMAQLPGNPSPEGRLAAMRVANNTAIANRQPPPFDPAKIAAMEEVQKIQATMGMSFAATISPRDSQQMQMAAIAAQPGLTQSPQGFQRLIGLYDGATSRSEDRLKHWDRWQQVNPHRYTGFDDDFNSKNPAVNSTIRALVENSPYPNARQRFPEAVKYLREHKDDAAYRAKFDKVYGGTSSFFLTGALDPYSMGAGQ